MRTIAKPFGWLMLQLYNWVGNYGVAVILFALFVKLILLPFQLKSTKSMMRMSRMTPRLKELEKKFGNDQQRYQQEMNKLYKEEGVNPMSGCLWTLIPFPILIALYYAIREPITTMMGVASDLMSEGGAIYEKLIALGFSADQLTTRQQAYIQIFQSKFITEHFADFQNLSEKLVALKYNFLGMDLASTPQFAFWSWESVDWNHIGLFLIPIISAVLSWLSMKVSNETNPQAQAQNAAANQSNKTMMLMMPLMSVWICYSMPGVMGIYWIAQSVFATLQTVILNKVFSKQLDIEDADRIEREKAREAELEAKREETERLRAEGITVENKNTSKKNKKAAAAQKEAERKAAEARAERARKRAERGEVEDIPASQVGNRRYARGRAYVPDRYTSPETAEEKTIAAEEENASYEMNKLPEEPATAAELSATNEDIKLPDDETYDDIPENAIDLDELPEEIDTMEDDRPEDQAEEETETLASDEE